MHSLATLLCCLTNECACILGNEKNKPILTKRILRYQIDGKKIERKVEGADNTLNIIFLIYLSQQRGHLRLPL